MNPKFAVILGLMGRVGDRFATYGDKQTLADLFELASQVEGLAGVELVYLFDFPDVEEVKRLLELAAEAAHSSARTAAPIACWIAGRSGLSAAELMKAARRAGAQ